MIFGSKTGYGRVDLILQPSHLQFRNEIDVRAPSKNWSTSELSLARYAPSSRTVALIRCDALKPRASAKSRWDRWPVYPTKLVHLRSDDCPGDAFCTEGIRRLFPDLDLLTVYPEYGIGTPCPASDPPLNVCQPPSPQVGGIRKKWRKITHVIARLDRANQYSLASVMESHRRVRQLNSPALRIGRAVPAPELQLAVDAFARGADGHPTPLPRDVQLGCGIGQRAKPSREADGAARSSQFSWSAITGAACRARFPSRPLADVVGGRTNSDRDSALSGEGLGAQQVASSCRTSCRTSTAAPSGTASAVPGAGIVGAGDAGGGVVLSASKDGTIRTVKHWLAPG